MNLGQETVTTDKTSYLQSLSLAPIDTSPPPDTTPDTFVPVSEEGLTLDPNNDRKNLNTNLSKFNVFDLPVRATDSVAPTIKDNSLLIGGIMLAAVTVAALSLRKA